MHETQQYPAVGGHRTGDVAQDDHPPGSTSGPPEAVTHRLASRAQSAAQGSPWIVASPGGGLEAPAPPERSGESEVSQELVQLCELLGGVEGKVLGSQYIDGAVAEPD